jgi:hypothetical protein
MKADKRRASAISQRLRYSKMHLAKAAIAIVPHYGNPRHSILFLVVATDSLL